jgi:hypothetical protein
VRCRVGPVVRTGRAVTVTGADPGRLAAAVEREESVETGGPAVAVDCPPPGRVHGYASPVREGMGLRVRTALAAAARSRGLTTDHDGTLATARERLADLDGEEGETATNEDARQKAAETADLARLRERVAAARGRLRAAREHGGDVAAASDDLAAAVRELTEAETAAAAARERLDAAREREREVRDRLERRRRLQDRVANLEREARAALVEEIRGEYADAVGELAGTDGPFEAPAPVAALAVIRLAAVDAPVVLDSGVGRFDSAAEAAAWLDAPVIYVR